MKNRVNNLLKNYFGFTTWFNLPFVTWEICWNLQSELELLFGSELKPYVKASITMEPKHQGRFLSGKGKEVPDTSSISGPYRLNSQATLRN